MTTDLHARMADKRRLVLRLFQGPEDFSLLSRIGAAARAADGHLEVNTPEMIASHYGNLSNCHLPTDLALAEIAGRAIGYVRTEWRDELSGDRVHQMVMFVDLVTDRTATADALLAWAEARSRAIAAEGPTDRRCVLALSPFGTGEVFAAHLESAGYRAVRYGFTMRRFTLDDVPDLPLPDGIEVRPARPEHLRAIFAADSEAFRDHWAAAVEDSSEASFRQFRDDPTNDLSLWRVAWQGDQIVGMVRGYVNEPENELTGRRLGWCECISVRRPWRGQGVARALIAMTLLEFRARGLTESALTVDAQNATGAMHLYELMGFESVARAVEWRKPLELRVASFGHGAAR